MPTRRNAWHGGSEEFLQAIAGAYSDLLLEGVAAGCAMVAHADGIVAPAETKRMMALIQRYQSLRAFHAGELLGEFERAAAWFAADPVSGEDRALEAIGRLRGKGRYAAMLLRTCREIAAADGEVSRSEADALIRICRALDLDPTEHGLIPAGGSAGA